MKFKGVIFDLDGVICFTDEYHFLAWKKLADELSIFFDRNINSRLRGVSRMESLEIILEQYYGPSLDADKKQELASTKNGYYVEFLKKMSLKDLPDDVRSVLHSLKQKGIKIAIGSSSKNAPLILSQIGLSDYFDAVSDGNNITHSKPHPEVFLKAAKALGLIPEECIVVEDAVAGAKAGHTGGFTVVCVGHAAEMLAGDYNISGISELLDIL